MGKALYRKYRSKKLSEIVGQEHITQALNSAIERGQISHAYLLTGPRGVGKTSVARIIAHEINNLPYEDDSSHLDIIEIDAASNRRIDEIRELREKVYVAPTQTKYKVYIIDEVHMLTKEAFNALLKTLEEPPAHAVFILATTDAHKVPNTIISRTQRFTFRPVAKEQVTMHLKQIAKNEKILIDDEALDLLADFGQGSFRDSINLLDQASGSGAKITVDTVQDMLGIPPDSVVTALIDQLNTTENASNIVKALDELYAQGLQASAIAEALGKKLRDNLVDGDATMTKAEVLNLLQELMSVGQAYKPERQLEIVLLRHSNLFTQPLPERTQTDSTALDAEIPTYAEPPTAPKNQSEPQNKEVSGAAIETDDTWSQLLQVLKSTHNTLYGVLRMARPNFDGDVLTLNLQFTFHAKRLQEPNNQKAIASALKTITNKAYVIKLSVEPAKTKTTPKTNKTIEAEPEELITISNIFGGGELIES